MARPFSLIGLLRLRHAQQDQAAGRLADANERLRDAADRRFAARRTLDESPVEITDAAMLSAVAAARASTRGMLHELDAVAQKRRAEADEAQAAFTEARRAALGLEKLEAKHVEAEAAADLRDEQLALDEIATTSWRPRPVASAPDPDPSGGAA
ncbi:flagellar export protein FliJ [Frigoribacterium sp. 2-23]|uniref:flagellar export protein FliJ n=1 Tax=Frigoribacterium sp. 2-23 TaxID=3415006 RepID=UPI003C6F3CB6